MTTGKSACGLAERELARPPAHLVAWGPASDVRIRRENVGRPRRCQRTLARFQRPAARREAAGRWRPEAGRFQPNILQTV